MTTFNGARMRRTRRKLGMTSLQLAEKVEVTRAQVSAWENGHYEPNLANLRKLAKALGVTADYLLENANP